MVFFKPLYTGLNVSPTCNFVIVTFLPTIRTMSRESIVIVKKFICFQWVYGLIRFITKYPFCMYVVFVVV